jgi:hypothetical protein
MIIILLLLLALGFVVALAWAACILSGRCSDAEGQR